ncbi:hypothetical protein CT0861_12843 [Colletotrichum tofieldiae]|uniref:Uncharacterized protein n=1 Tax=Colletotrichum tofieldiae TaxID=708197 RepID=A0A166S8E7_9PEZI|nr:hypothetical protein CT0861_12843 [Colletotrichum tofieldiae]
MELRTTLPLHGDADELLGATTVRPTHAAVYSRASTVLLTSLEGEARYLGQELRATADAARDLSDPWPHGAWYLASHLPPGGLPESLLREMVAFSCLLTNHMARDVLRAALQGSGFLTHAVIRNARLNVSRPPSPPPAPTPPPARASVPAPQPAGVVPGELDAALHHPRQSLEGIKQQEQQQQQEQRRQQQQGQREEAPKHPTRGATRSDLCAGNNGAIFGDWPEMSPIQDYGDNGGNDYNNLNIDDDDDDDDDDDNLSSTDWQSIRWA